MVSEDNFKKAKQVSDDDVQKSKQLSEGDVKKTKNVSEDDVKKAKHLFKTIIAISSQINEHAKKLIGKLQSGESHTTQGLSILELKNRSLLQYVTNVMKVIHLKVQGLSMNDHPSIFRLIELRTVLEKIRPIERKIGYQIDKLVKVAKTGLIDNNDPLAFKPNVDNLMEDEEDDADESDEQEGKDVGRKYRPPKLAPMPYEADETQQQREARLLERAKKRALSSRTVKEMFHDLDDRPEEIVDAADMHGPHEDREGKDRTSYEEKYFVRMQVKKKSKNIAKKLSTLGDELTSFADISALTDNQLPTRKRKKTGGKHKGKGKKKRKIRM